MKRRGYRATPGKNRFVSSMSGRKRALHGGRKGAKALARFDALISHMHVQQEQGLLGDLARLQVAIGPEFEGPRPTRMTGLGGYVPVQGYGETDSGEQWYFRYRHDEATLVVYDDDMFQPSHGAWCYSLTGDEYGGYLEHEEALAVVIALWKRMGTGRGPGVEPAVVRAESGVAEYVEEVEKRNVQR